MIDFLRTSRNLLFAGGVWLFLSAMAQSGIGIAPARYELVVKPGQTENHEFTVFSREVERQLINVDLLDWTTDPTGTLITLPAGNLQYSAAKWLTVAVDPFDLSRDKPVSVRFGVSLPLAGEFSGSYRTAVVFSTQPRSRAERGLGTLFQVKVLGIVYVTIQGTEKPAAALQGVSLVAAKGGGSKLVADVVNKGNVYLRLNGELRFVNAKGEVVKRAPLSERVLLRDGLVRYELPVPADLPEDVVLAAIEIQPQGPAKSYGGPPLYGEVDLK